MEMVKIRTAMLAAGMAAGLAGTALAEEPHYDVWIGMSGGGITIGAITEDGSETVAGVRVFGAELGEILPDFSAEPGMQGIDGTFAAGDRFGLRILRATRSWNGTDFSAVASSRFQLDFGPQQMVSPISDEVVGGIELAADAEGGIHDHPTFTLLDPSAGIFLLEMSVVSIGDVYAGTQPFWIVFNNGESEEAHEAAIDWVNDNLVPTPGVAVVAGVGLLAMGRRRR